MSKKKLKETVIFQKMKKKDFGESMCDDTKLKVLQWIIKELKPKEDE